MNEKAKNQDFDVLVRLVRKGISLSKNKRLREALSERGDPARRLDKELPAEVVAEWAELHPDREPPASEEDITKGEIRSLVNKVSRRLEKQGDEKEDKLTRALRRMPASDDDEEARYAAEQKVGSILGGADFTPREQEFLSLYLGGVEDEEIAERMGIERRSMDKTKSRLMKKLRESAEKQGIRGF